MIRRITAAASGIALAVLTASGAGAAAASPTAAAARPPGTAAQAPTVSYLSQFGSQGTGAGQFESPAAIAVNPNTGDVYVTDISTDVVEEFTASGSYLSEFGGPGSGSGQFNDPISIAVDPGSGDVYVLDLNSGIGFDVARIQKFDTSGNFLTSWTVGSFFTNQVAVDPATGDVYATDSDGNQVIEFDPSGNQIGAFGSQGPDPGQFENPGTIAVDPSDGDLYVADNNQAALTLACRVQKFDSSFSFLFQFGGCGSGDGQFCGCGGLTESIGPTGLAVDPGTGDFYAVDSGNNRVEVLDSSGNFLAAAGWGVADGAAQFETCTSSCQAGISGAGDGQFSNPVGGALNPGTGQLYVVDNFNDRVEVFATGQVEAAVSVSPSADPSVSGQPVTFTATVTAVAGAPAPAGTVQFAVDGQDLGTPVTVASGSATSASVSSLAVGHHAVTATYTPTDGTSPITATMAPDQNVQQGATTTTLTSAPNPAKPGQAVTYTATVAPAAPAAGTPTGTVSFADGDTPIPGCTAQALTGATATCTVAVSSIGLHPVTATYGGDTSFAASPPSNVDNQCVGRRCVPPPTIKSITPGTGPAAGGTPVLIQGRDLCQAKAVHFGPAAAASFKVVRSPTICEVTAASPPGTGVVDVTETTPWGTSATGPQDQFTYFGAPVVTAIAPAAGPAAGGTQVVITGDTLCPVTGVDFGKAAATGVTVSTVSPGVCQVTATSPPGAGSVDVTVTSPAGASATGPQDQFSYADDPVITSITPGSGTGIGGTQVVIQGLNLCPVTGVTFGTAAASFTVTTVSPGVCSVAATSPAGTGVVTVTVTSPDGTSTTRFSYLPAISSLRPAIGPGTGGTHVVIKGSNLCQATGVAFGKTAATRVSVSTQSPGVCQVAATSPAGTGVVDVTVVSPGGTSTTGRQDLFYYPPIVFGSKPTSGPAAGGTKITINGENQCQATGVEFGKVAATSFTVISTPVKGVCQVRATSPPGTGTVRVTVLSPGGHSVGPPHRPYPAGFTYR